jgi:RNA polymerase sigma-70 factor (ECF subfamily)
MIHNEEKLLQRIRSGDDEAFALLMEQYADQVYALVVRIIQQREDAEELTQDVFIKAYEQMESFSGRSSFATWLYRIAYNCAISHTRRHRVSHLSIDEGRIAAVRDEDIEQMEGDLSDHNIDALMEAIEQLNAEERALVTLFYYEQRPIAECAEIIRQSESNTKVRLHRIRKKLYLLITHSKDETEQ